MSKLKKALIVWNCHLVEIPAGDRALRDKALAFLACVERHSKMHGYKKGGTNPLLRSNHDICRFVMPGFFCRLFLFRCFGLSRFVDMFFRFL